MSEIIALYFLIDVNGLTAQIAHLLLDVSRNNDVAKSMETAQGLKLQRVS